MTRFRRELRWHDEKGMERDAIEHAIELDAGTLHRDSLRDPVILLDNLRRHHEVKLVLDPRRDDPGGRAGVEDPRDKDVRVENDLHRRPRTLRVASTTSARLTPARRACERTLPMSALSSLFAGTAIR